MLLGKSQTIIKPINVIVFFAAIYYLLSSVAVYLGGYPSYEFQLLWYISNSLFIAWWVIEDKKKQNYHAPYEFGAFVFFAWLIVVPYYLWRTRGRKSFGWSILVILYFYLPNIYWCLVESYWWGS